MPSRSKYSSRSSVHQPHGSKYRVRSVQYQLQSTNQVQPARLRPSTASEAVRIDGRHYSLVPRPMPTLLTLCLDPSSRIKPSWLQDLPSKKAQRTAFKAPRTTLLFLRTALEAQSTAFEARIAASKALSTACTALSTAFTPPRLYIPYSSHT
jgi:hypothetical protein